VIVHAAKNSSWLTRNVWVLSAVSFLQDTASELLYPLLPIYLTAVLGAPPAVVGAVEGAAEGAASLTKVAAGPLGDRFARRPLITAGYGMAALGKVIVAVAGGWPGVLTGRVVDRVGKGVRGAPRDNRQRKGLLQTLLICRRQFQPNGDRIAFPAGVDEACVIAAQGGGERGGDLGLRDAE